MGPLYMWSVIDQNDVMWHTTVNFNTISTNLLTAAASVA